MKMEYRYVDTLLILDGNATIEDIIRTYNGLFREMQKKYGNGVVILANDEVIKENQLELAVRAGIRFFPNWEVNDDYRNMLRAALRGDEIYIMKKVGQQWTYEKAKRREYEILEQSGRINLKPK